MFHIPNWQDRKTFGLFLNRLGLLGTAIEVGVHRAEFAFSLLSSWNGGRLLCVDPWDQSIPDYIDPVNQGVRDIDYTIAKKALAKFGERAVFHRKTSEQAALEIPDGSIDFIYIDANHHYKHVLHDLGLWWPKLQPRGIIAGHDIICPGEKRGEDATEHVQKAVWEFFPFNTRIYLVSEPQSLPWSFYVKKEDYVQ